MDNERLSFTYDREADAAYVPLSAGTVASTREVAEHIVADFDAEGRLVGVEVLAVTGHVAGGDVGSYLKGLVAGLLAGRSEAAE